MAVLAHSVHQPQRWERIDILLPSGVADHYPVSGLVDTHAWSDGSRHRHDRQRSGRVRQGKQHQERRTAGVMAQDHHLVAGQEVSGPNS